MNDHPAIDDAALRAMLDGRARRASAAPLDLDSIVAAAGPRSSRRLRTFNAGPRLALGGALAAVLVAALLASPFVSQPVGHASASPSGSSLAQSNESSAPSPSAPAQLDPLRLLAAADAGSLIRTQAAALPGTLIAVDGRLEADPSRCRRVESCDTIVLADSGNGFTVRPVGDIGPGPWSGSGPLEGALILRLSGATENGSPVVEFVGRLSVPPTRGPAWFVQDIIEGAVDTAGAYVAVQGWLVRGPFHPCPSDPRNPPVAYGCPTDDWLSESDYQPYQPDGSMIGPSAGIYLSSGSYDRWAPGPARAGLGGRGVEPRQGTYLLRLVSDGCGPNADCLPPAPRWRIVGRFDPIQPGSFDSSPSATPGPTLGPTGEALTAAELAVQRPGSTTNYLVRAWLGVVLTPGVRCAHPRPSGWPVTGCSEVDWLTDTPSDPAFTASNLGDRVVVQNGAYVTFAQDPQFADNIGEPRLGIYLVQVAIHSTCETILETPTPACAGGPVWTFELVGRVDPPHVCQPTNGVDVCRFSVAPPLNETVRR